MSQLVLLSPCHTTVINLRMKRIELLDFIRGFSIFTIVLMHLCQSYTNGIFNKAFAFGGAGVHVFILCSGLGLYLSYLRKPLNYKDFLLKRFTKVYVPYIIAVLLWGVWFMYKNGAFPMKEIMSHLLLYKMFSVELDTSLCYPYWFISTIIQLYLVWPLIVHLIRCKGGYFYSFIISLLWSTLVGVLGYEEIRPWGSFFLQYLWEFCLGMWIAENYMYTNRGKNGKDLLNISYYQWWWLLGGAIGGMGISAFMAWNGGILKLYNDIPSLVGYLSILLIIYKLGIGLINSFFVWANSFSYELYLVHSLVFIFLAYVIANETSLYILLSASLILAYTVGYEFNWLLKKIKLK